MTLRQSRAGSLFVFLLALTCFSNAAIAQTWSSLSPTGTAPQARQGHSAVYDPNSNEMIVFGGRGSSGLFNDVWILTNPNNLSGTAQWIALSPAGTPPPARWMHGAAYDAAHNRMIIFGGQQIGSCLDDVWVLKNANNVGGTPTWELLSPSGTSPGQRSSFISAYAGTRNKLIVAGGNDCSTWTHQDAFVLSNADGFGGVTPSWTNISPSGSVPVPPTGEVFGANIYDPVSDRVLFWGYTYPLDKFAILSGAGAGTSASWNSLTLTTQPTTAAAGQTAAYNSSSNKAVFFGGTLSSSGGSSAELWGLGNANGVPGTPTWTLISASGTVPTSRQGHTAVYDSVHDVMMVFGGSNGGSTFLNDVSVLASATQFTWTPPDPSLTAINPTSGSVGTTTNVTLTGADFEPGHTSVVIAGTGVTISNVQVTSSTTLTASFAIDAAAQTGPRGVTVETSVGTSNSISFSIVVNRPPTLNSVAPASGAVNSVANVTLTGRNFVAGATTVVIAGSGVTAGTINVTSPTTLSTTFTIAGSASGSVGVTVATAFGTSSTRTFTIVTSGPTLAAITPSSGNARAPVGVILSGTNFVPGQTSIAVAGSSGVSVGTINVVNSTYLVATFTIDASAATGPRGVTVSTPIGTSNSAVFTVTSAVPSLNGMTPASGSPAVPTNVVLTGLNFEGSSSVISAGTSITVSNVTVNSSTRITATFTVAPGSAPGLRGVTVSTAFGTSNTRNFNVLSSAPTITAISPSGGSALAPVTVTLAGTNFVTGASTQVSAGTDITVSNVNVVNPTRITATFTIASAAAAGSRSITVSTSFGTSNSSNFTVAAATPTLTTISPPSGSRAVPVNVTLTGTNFVTGGATQVYAGTDVAVSNINVLNSTRLTATFTVAAGAPAGGRGVTVSSSFGTSNTRTFTVVSAVPSLAGISPNYGGAVAPVNVILTGTNFLAGGLTYVSAGTDVTVSNVTVTSSTRLTATFTIAGSAAAGTRGVTVSTSYGTSGSRPFLITSPVPTLGTVSPALGNAAVPVNVTLLGNNFMAGGGATQVSVGTDVTVSNIHVVDPTMLTATFTVASGAAPGSRGVTISTSFGTSNSRTFLVTSPAPGITGLTPSSGSAAAPVNVTLTGSNFITGGSTQISAGTGVTVSNINVISPTRLTARFTIAADAPTGSHGVTVSTSFGTSNVRQFTVTATAPTLSMITPDNGDLAGSPVDITLTGNGFVTGQTFVNVAGSGVTVSNVHVTSSTTLTATLTIAVDAPAAPRNVSVTTLLGTSNSVVFTVH